MFERFGGFCRRAPSGFPLAGVVASVCRVLVSLDRDDQAELRRLLRVLSAYAAYYNQARTHLALQKDAPLHRAVQRPGVIVAIPILAGLHHQYVRI